MSSHRVERRPRQAAGTRRCKKRSNYFDDPFVPSPLSFGDDSDISDREEPTEIDTARIGAIRTESQQQNELIGSLDRCVRLQNYEQLRLT